MFTNSLSSRDSRRRQKMTPRAVFMTAINPHEAQAGLAKLRK